ncbi:MULTISPECIES: phage holin family protein [Comamonas]|uniref:Phage holin family protein n=1 Tax=Comamonas terrigena TaxID=32013 RepID=A0A2A7UWJ1_COMTR|nr:MULTISPECIES: phage holin family protein [Comamonas]MBD9531566.1 phage holin family protein [Comamonas sp. CMM01]MBV7417547.1 phage holin family protein [Comamonas sp. CMM03]MDH0051068.1 phage holin family protein [Comamonas terrigena]MDH0513533.1 phage holin family protein [Comamonas terrigena]MDH1093013.1 phage holin family protein [Comamonas terrigena]
MNWLSALGLDTLVARYRAAVIEAAIASEDRVELAKLEWKLQRNRLQSILVLAIALGGLTVVAMVLLSLAILIQFWNSPDRATVAWVIAAVWVAAWGGVLWALLSALRKSRSPFMQTRAELAKDWQSIKEKL